MQVPVVHKSVLHEKVVHALELRFPLLLYSLCSMFADCFNESLTFFLSQMALCLQNHIAKNNTVASFQTEGTKVSTVTVTKVVWYNV